MLNVYELNNNFYPNYLIKCGTNSSILINCPAGTQRLISAYNLNCNYIKSIIITDNSPQYIEGLPGLLMTIFSVSKKDNKDFYLIIPSSNKIDYYINLNLYAQQPYWFGNIIYLFTNTQLRLGKVQIDFKTKRNQFDKLIINSFIIDSKEQIYKVNKQKLQNCDIDKHYLSQLLKDGFYNQYKIDDIFDIKKAPIIYYNEHPIDDNNFILKQNNTIQTLASPYLYYLIQKQQLNTDNLLQLQQYGIIHYELFPHIKVEHLNDLSVKNINDAYEKYPIIKQQFQQNSNQNKIIFIGTSASQPTKYRNVSGLIIQINNQQLIFDPGEQFTENYSKLNLQKDNILIFTSHEHADHFLGINNLIRYINNQCQIFTQDIVQQYINSQYQCDNVTILRQQTININNIKIKTFKNNHTLNSLSIIINSDNNLIFYSGDCKYDFKQGNTVYIIHECTYLKDEDRQLSVDRQHTLLSDLMQEVQKLQNQGINVKKVFLTHFSSKYQKEVLDLDNIYQQTYDGMIYEF